MFKPGDRVDLTYYEFDEQVESHSWLIEDYDNGLIKVVREPSPFNFTKMALEKAGRKSEPSEPKREIVVFNLRSIGFLKAELVE